MLSTRTAMLAAVALLAAVLACCIAPAAGHAVMIDPKSRPWYDYLENYNYNPHAVYGGGVNSVSDGGKLQWPARKVYSICGDSASERKWDNPGKISKTYSAGQTINVDVVFAQNHLGRMNVRVCPLDAKDESQCKTLERADGKGSDFDLPWTPGWSGVTDGFTAPVNTDGFQIYKMPPVGKSEGCGTWACDQFKGQYVYRSMWKLPPGFTCSHCKLQWYYLTASRCWPPCKSGDCKKPVPYGYCNQSGQSYPEEFWNCADIKIDGNSGRKLRGVGGTPVAGPDRFPELM